MLDGWTGGVRLFLTMNTFCQQEATWSLRHGNLSFEITKYSKHDRNHGIDFHLRYDTDTVIEMVNSFVWDDSDLFNGSVAVVEAAIAELFLKFLHLMSLPTDDYWAVNDFADDQCRGPSVKEKDHLAW